MSRPLAGKGDSAGIAGGLFPHPPHPSEFQGLVSSWLGRHLWDAVISCVS